MSWWEWLLWSTVAPMPAFAVWRWRVRQARIKWALEAREYRRQKFGGAISVRGKVTPVERPPR